MKRMIAAACVALAGCAATGVKVSEAQLSALHKGQTTVQETVALLGEPTSRVSPGDGSTTLVYVYAESKIRASSFVPIVGAFAGGSDVRSSMATLHFDAAGKLDNITSSSSQYGTGTGLAAGQVEPGQVQQPRQ